MLELEWNSAVQSSIIKLGISAFLAFLIGLERELRGHQAGIRTHMLLAIGVTLFTELSVNFSGDKGRVAAQVVTGIGFLGAGAILRIGGDVKGLTTSASIWAVSAIAMGVSVGGPFITISIIATIMTLFTLGVVELVEIKWVKSKMHRRMNVQTENQEAMFAIVDEVSNRPGTSLRSVHVIRRDTPVEATLTLRGKDDLINFISRYPGVLHAEWLN